jgi:integrase
MATVSFLLKEPKGDRPTPIFAFLSFDGQRAKVYTGLKILPTQWNIDDQRAKLRGYPANGALNDTLDLQEQQLLACYADHRANGQLPTATTLRVAIAPEAEPEPVAPPAAAPDLFARYAEWIALAHAQGRARSASVYETNLRHLRRFAEATPYAVSFESLTPTFGDRFTAWLMQSAGLTDNTIDKQITTLKRFCRWCQDRDYTDTRGWEKLKWKRREPDVLTLTREEVTALAELDLPAGGYLDNARTLFLLACYTGLRYSDVIRLRPEHVRATTLRITTQKTGESVTIPLHPHAYPLLQRLLAGEVRLIANQKLNEYLKVLGERAGINAPTERTRYRGGERLSQTAPKYALLGCHTGRRTFVTLALENGIAPEVVMKVTGHRDYKSFKRYVNITEQRVEREFARSWEGSK